MTKTSNTHMLNSKVFNDFDTTLKKRPFLKFPTQIPLLTSQKRKYAHYFLSSEFGKIVLKSLYC